MGNTPRCDDHLGFDCPSELKERAEAAAARDGRSLSSWLRHTLRRTLEVQRRIYGEEAAPTISTVWLKGHDGDPILEDICTESVPRVGENILWYPKSGSGVMLEVDEVRYLLDERDPLAEKEMSVSIMVTEHEEEA